MRPLFQHALYLPALCFLLGAMSAGAAASPMIEVGDLNFGTMAVGGVSSAMTLEIRNTATEGGPLTITGIAGADAPSGFLFPNGLPAFPFDILPGQSRKIHVAFIPAAITVYEAELVVHSNATGGDSIVMLNGAGVQTVLTATSQNWSRRRIGHAYDAEIVLKNRGEQAAMGLTFQLEGNGDAFEVLGFPAYSGTGLAAGDSIVFQVRFKPEATGAQEMKIVYGWNPGDQAEVASVLRGFGTRPELLTADCDFGPVDIGEPERDKKIFFFAPDNETQDSVTITGFRFESDSSGDDADFRYALLQPVTFPFVLRAGESIDARVYFQPRGEGTRRATLTALTLDSVDLTSHWKGVGVDEASSVARGAAGSAGIQISPNPAGATGTMLRYTLATPAPVHIDLLDARGAMLRTIGTSERKEPGTYQQRVDLAGLPSGTYFMRLRMGKQTLVEPVVVAR